ncbi:glutamyl-tRNA synthetase [Altererythrobacter sp. B11]|uniref:HIG1 domain-containing protein n=1 Tax=Altererythrobacter sp. B11 TaxID=2060312 RepID=UPI000DC715B3|nr:HIG1 domain-containing protein [Altererythrobacter sp. B11]BBC71626.1 glutamyl-tRNA synthetase [Altererythrobacter sp. B11]
MNYILIPLLIAIMIAVVVALVRGIIAFLQASRLDLEEDSDRVTELQLKQNKMMFARIKYQALAIAVVAVLLAISR